MTGPRKTTFINPSNYGDALELAEQTFGRLEQYVPEAGAVTDALRGILKERGAKHGDWKSQAAIAQNLKKVFEQGHLHDLLPDEREALEMIAVKVSRILSGDPHFEDHWRDIAGYATLVADSKTRA